MEFEMGDGYIWPAYLQKMKQAKIREKSKKSKKAKVDEEYSDKADAADQEDLKRELKLLREARKAREKEEHKVGEAGQTQARPPRHHAGPQWLSIWTWKIQQASSPMPPGGGRMLPQP